MNLMRRLWRLPRLNLGFSRRVRYITLVGARFHFFMIDDPLLLDWRPCCWCVVRHVRQPLMPNSNRDTYIARRAAYNDEWCARFVLRWGVTIQVGLGWRRSPCQRRQRTPPIYCALQWKVLEVVQDKIRRSLKHIIIEKRKMFRIKNSWRLNVIQSSDLKLRVCSTKVYHHWVRAAHNGPQNTHMTH